MAIGDRRFECRLSTLAFAAATAAAVAFAALAAGSDLNTGIALNVGPAGLVPTSARRHADQKVTDQFTTFYECWTSTVETKEMNSGH